MIKQRIMYVCSECAEGCPEACGHYDRTELRVMPDGAWLCESCFDNNDDNEFLSWGHLPAPEEYGRIPASAQGARKAPKINHEAWSKSLIGFIRSKGLERELTDWCGGWKCPIQSSDGGGEVRPANTANMPGSVPGEEVSSSAGGIERTTVRETALTSCAGVTPGPSEALSGTSLARWCYENPNLAARTIEGLRALSEGDRGMREALEAALPHLEMLHSLIPMGDARRFVLGVVKKCRAALAPPSHPSTQSLRQEG